MPTRLTYRQAGARATGPLFTGTATSGSTTALVEMTAYPFQSTIAEDERFENYIVHRPGAAAAGDRVRTVKTYDPSAGQFTVNKTYTNAAYSGGVGESIELIGTLDVDTLHRLVNDALRLCDVFVEVTFTPSTNTTVQHSLASAASWLTDPHAVFQVGYLTSGESRTTTNPFDQVVRGEATQVGSTVYLNGFSLPTTVTCYVLVARPAYTYCKASGGSFGDLTAGLTAETDEAVPEEEWVAAGVRMLAWDEWRDLFFPGNRQIAQEEVARAADRFWSLARAYAQPPDRTFRRPLQFGPSGGRSRVVGYPSP